MLVNPDKIIVYCNECGWIVVKRDKVDIVIDLQDDTIKFRGDCLKCGEFFFNSRNI